MLYPHTTLLYITAMLSLQILVAGRPGHGRFCSSCWSRRLLVSSPPWTCVSHYFQGAHSTFHAQIKSYQNTLWSKVFFLLCFTAVSTEFFFFPPFLDDGRPTTTLNITTHQYLQVFMYGCAFAVLLLAASDHRSMVWLVPSLVPNRYQPPLSTAIQGIILQCFQSCPLILIVI